VSDPEVYSVAAPTHGRVLVRRATSPLGVLTGFHGYLESASTQLARLESIPGSDRWTLVSIQGLNRVYRGRSQEVVAGWMTRQDREDAIADNLAYVSRALEAVGCEPGTPVVHAGFSQGVAMAFRAAVRGGGAGVIAVGGDVPPELLADPAARFPRVLLARGQRDEWYSAAAHAADVAALRARRVEVEPLVYDGAHEWTPEVSAAAGAWL
jgi:predicted esterase